MGRANRNGLLTILDEARELNSEQFDLKYEKYIKQGLSKSDSDYKAEIKIKELDRNEFMIKYKEFLRTWYQCQKTAAHMKINEYIHELIDRGYKIKKAVNASVEAYAYRLEPIFQVIKDSENSESENDTDSENEDDEDDNDTDHESEYDDSEHDSHYDDSDENDVDDMSAIRTI